MKKILLILVLIGVASVYIGAALIGYAYNPPHIPFVGGERKMIGKKIVYYTEEDSKFMFYGIFKEEIRTYNYEYEDSVCHYINLYTDAFINEYGDTVLISYVDLSYPTKESPRLYAD